MKLELSSSRISASVVHGNADIRLIDLILSRSYRIKRSRQYLSELARKLEAGDKSSAMADLKIAFHKLEKPSGKHLPKLQAPKKPSLPREMVRARWEDYLGQSIRFLTSARAYECAHVRNRSCQICHFCPDGAYRSAVLGWNTHYYSSGTYQEISSDRFARELETES